MVLLWVLTLWHSQLHTRILEKHTVSIFGAEEEQQQIYSRENHSPSWPIYTAVTFLLRRNLCLEISSSGHTDIQAIGTHLLQYNYIRMQKHMKIRVCVCVCDRIVGSFETVDKFTNCL
jgi:hypothetical protein